MNNINSMWLKKNVVLRNFRSISIILLVGIYTLSATLAQAANLKDKIIIPEGIPGEGVSCDFSTIMWFPVGHNPIALNRDDSGILIFGRYWVTPETIRMEILWSEPSWGPQPFATHPPGLILVATKQKFVLGNALHPDLNEYKIPYGVRPPASDVAGSWDIKNIRFAWSEYLEEQREYEKPLKSIIRMGKQLAPDTILPDEEYTVLDGKLTELKASLFNNRKKVSYKYQTMEGQAWLSSETVLLPQQPIAAIGLVGDLTTNGAAASTNGSVRYHRQGRLSTVQWKVKSINNANILVPDALSVHVMPLSNSADTIEPTTIMQSRYSAGGKIEAARRVIANNGYSAYSELGLNPIRSMVLSGYKQIEDSDINALADTSPLYNGASLARVQWYNKIQNKYWRSTMAESDLNRVLLDQLLSKMANEYGQEAQPGKKLQYLYVQIISSLILDDSKHFAQLVDEYVQTLNIAGAQEIVQSCLLNLKGLCSNWSRESFVAIVQKKLDIITN